LSVETSFLQNDYGVWVNSIINLSIVGMMMFIAVKAYQKMKPAPPKSSPKKGPNSEEILLELGELLKTPS